MSNDSSQEQTVALTGTVQGRVQGVNFRSSMQREAQRLGVVGWVRNLPDGSVQFQVQGTRSALDRLMAWSGVGPPFARVDSLEVEAREAVALSSFEILR